MYLDLPAAPRPGQRAGTYGTLRLSMSATSSLQQAHALRAVLVRTPAGGRLLLPTHLARAVGSGVELALLEHLATAPALPDGWTDIDRAQLAGELGTSLPNLRRALGRLKSLGLVEQKRPRSSLWRIRPDLLERLEAAPERG